MFLVGVLAAAAAGGFFLDPTFATWKQYGFAFSAVFNFACVLAMGMMLRKIPESGIAASVGASA